MGRTKEFVMNYKFLKDDGRYAYFQIELADKPKTYVQVDRYLLALIELYFNIVGHLLGVKDVRKYLGETKTHINVLAFYWNGNMEDAFVERIPARWRSSSSFMIIGFTPEVDNELEDNILKIDKEKMLLKDECDEK